MATLNASFASPLANAAHAKIQMQMPVDGIVARVFNGLNVWSALLGVLLLLVSYDQCECE